MAATWPARTACPHPASVTRVSCRPTSAGGLIDELARMRVFYVNVGGGEPLVRRDFLDLVDYAVDRRVGVKFSTNGALITPQVAARIAATDYLDVQISIDGATPRPTTPCAGRAAMRWPAGEWTGWPRPASARSRSRS